MLKSGTLTDKLSAYVVQVQNSPVHHFAGKKTLQLLIWFALSVDMSVIQVFPAYVKGQNPLILIILHIIYKL